MIESRLNFTFDEKFQVVKFDDTDFYRFSCSSMPNGKAVDFVADSQERMIFMEVKNCTGYENDTKWRTNTDYTVLKDSERTIDESFDIEVAKKVLCTMAFLSGVNSRYKFRRRNGTTASVLRSHGFIPICFWPKTFRGYLVFRG